MNNKEKVEITFAWENDTVIIPSKRDEDGGFMQTLKKIIWLFHHTQ